MTVSERIKQIMDRESLNASAFADSIGVAQATIAHILSGRNKYPSLEVLSKLQHRYPYVSLDWLVNGESDLFSPDNANPSNEKEPSPADRQAESENIEDLRLKLAQVNKKLLELQSINNQKYLRRKIVEIKIFYDDNTVETFKIEK